MDITPLPMTISQLVDKFADSGEGGVVAYGGKLDVRPPYQREFVYNDKQQQAVINSVLHGYPIGAIYLVDADGTGEHYEMLDGQQRTLSICRFVAQNGYSVTLDNGNRAFFANLRNLQQAILDYQLLVFVCTGDETERLEWFGVLNTAGERLNEQEIRNANYNGPWVSDARRLFSKTNCPASRNGYDKFMAGRPLRQDYLETVLLWLAMKDNCDIPTYMAKHQHDEDAHEMWEYYEKVMRWVQSVFTTYRKEMKGQPWGILYDEYHERYYDAAQMEACVADLMANDEVTNKRGIYQYVFDGDESHLNVRQFSAAQKRTLFERCHGKCVKCGKTFKLEEMEADHITPWSLGGVTELSNGQMLCVKCNRTKSNK